MDALKTISDASLKQEVPAFAVGDTVKVHVRIKEVDKSRIQVFEGTVIAKKHGGISETFYCSPCCTWLRYRACIPAALSGR